MGKHTVVGILSGVALVASSVATATPYAHHGAPRIYGSFDIAVQNSDTDNGTTSTDQWEVESYTSILGLKGKEHLSDDFCAIYKYELEIDPEEDSVNDSSDSDFLKAREQYVGLRGNFGTLRLGRIDTPLKKSQGKVDLFGDHEGDLKTTLVGEERKGNQINYTSPTIADAIALQLGLIQGEGANIDGKTGLEDGIGDAVSFNATYNMDNVYLGFGYDDGVQYNSGSLVSMGVYDTWQLVGGIKLNAVKLGAVFQNSEESNTDEKITGFLLSAAYDLNGTVLKAQYADSETENAAGTTLLESSNISLGVDKHYTKTTTVYAEFNQTSRDIGTSDIDITIFGVGIRKHF
ncbi:MAG: porin [Gammaproteobacteria bacterium]